MKDIPSKIKCGGNTYKVEIIKTFPDKGDKILGFCNVSQNKITLCTDFNGNKRSIYKIHESLLHECLHLIEYEWNASLEHTFLTQFSIGLYQVLRENDLMLDKTIVPKKVKVAGMDYKVLYPYTFYDDGYNKYSYIGDPDSLEIKLSNTDEYGFKCHSSYVKQDFLFSVGNAIYISYLNTFPDICPSEEIFSAFIKGLYQVIVDNKLNELIRKVK